MSDLAPAPTTMTITVAVKGNPVLVTVTGEQLQTSVVNLLLTITSKGTTVFQSIDWQYWQPV